MKDKLAKLMEKEGFILILFLCVCLVAGGTLYLSMRNINQAKNNLGNDNFEILDGELEASQNFSEFDPQDLISGKFEFEGFQDTEEAMDDEVEELEELEVVDENLEEDEEEVLEVILPENDMAEVEVEDLEFEDDEADQDWEAVESTSIATFALPVEGEVITEYTSDTLVYSETLESWVGHGAIDIKASQGTIVKAAGDGVVKEVYEDALWGIVIVIDHGSEILTRYSNLLTKDMVSEGVNVKKGDHISKVGSSAKIEMLMEPHLHFEVIKNGKIVDPRSIMN